MAAGIKGFSIALMLLGAGAAHAQTGSLFGGLSTLTGAQPGAAFSGMLSGQTGARTGATGDSAYKAATAQMNQCAGQVNAQPQWAPLFVHFPASAASPSLSQLADQSYPLPAELALLDQHHEAIAACRSALIDRLQSVSPAMADLYAQGFAEADQGMLALAQRKITWGAANQARQQKVLAFHQRLVSAERQMPAEPRQASAQPGLGRPQIMNVMAIGLNAALAGRSFRPAEPTCGAGWSYNPCTR